MTEMGVLFLKLRKNLPMRSPHWAVFKETIHIFQGNSLGFWNKEKYEEDGAQHEGGKEEPDPSTHSGEHLRSEAGDQEGPEPVGAGRRGLGKSSDAGVKHFLWQVNYYHLIFHEKTDNHVRINLQH
jgi:hypothetical protein